MASNEDIKHAIYENLMNALNCNIDIRNQGEENLKKLKFTEGYGVYLAEIVINQTLDLGLRQMAAVMLKQYVEKHWCQEDAEEDNSTLVATNEAKSAIKTILPDGLHDPNSKIRNQVAYTISSIASFDWPSDWKELFDIIVKCLGGNQNSVDGAMRVLVEFTYELEDQVKEVGPMILSEVYRIFEAETVYSVKTRYCAVEILNSLLKCINTQIESKQVQANMLNPILPTFLEKLVQGITIPNGPTSSFGMKKEIIKVLTYMLAEMPKFITQYMPQILPSIWQLLTHTADIYIKFIVNSLDNPFSEAQDDSEEGERREFINMILQIFEFIHSLIESKKFRQNVKNVVSDLVYIMILYMQITEEQIEEWGEVDGGESFLEDEDEEGIVYSVRTSGLDILLALGQEFEEKVLQGLSEALTKHVVAADADRNAGKPHWWKTHEAGMLAVGSFKDMILDNEAKFNLTEYLNLIRNLLTYQVSPLLTGRCICTLSKYVESDLSNVYFGELVDTTVNCLAADKPIVLRICAVRSIHSFYTNLKELNNERKIYVASKLETFLDGLIQFIPMCRNSVLGLIMETLSVMLSFDANFTASSSPKVIPLVIALFLKYHDDRFLLELVQEIMKTLSQNPYCLQPLQEKIVPTLVNILNLEGEKMSGAPMQDIALDVLETIVKYSKPPLSNLLIESAFPAAINCILRTEDHSVMQSGGECLRAFLFVSPEQVCTYKNGEGLNNILQVTTMLLNPMSTEYSATFIGRLVITLITKAGNFLGEQIDLLLKAVISKMQLVESLTVIMSLVMTFAHLILVQMDAVLNFLSTVPGPTGEPAMNFVFAHWLTRQHMFYGSYERRVSTMALCKIFEYAITSKDQRLLSVTVKDPVEAASNPNKPRTRSQTQSQTQWVSIPIMVKIFKLLINELSNLREVREAKNNNEDDDDDQDASDDDNGVDSITSPGKNLSAFMLFDGDDETEEEDNQLLQELQQDPIFKEDMEKNLSKFLLNFSRDENFGSFLEQLNESERKVLENLQMVGV